VLALQPRELAAALFFERLPAQSARFPSTKRKNAHDRNARIIYYDPGRTVGLTLAQRSLGAVLGENDKEDSNGHAKHFA
jgi:hypothetical protein